MKIILKLIESGKTQTLNNVTSLSESENIVEVKTTKETFKVDKNKVDILAFIESISVSNRDKLMDELNIKMNELLESQQNGKAGSLEDVEEIKTFIRNYEGVSESDKKDLIKKIDLLMFEIVLKGELS